MRDNISEIIEELEGYGVPKELCPLIVANLIEIGASAAVFRQETLDEIARVAAEKCKEKWPSGRLRA